MIFIYSKNQYYYHFEGCHLSRLRVTISFFVIALYVYEVLLIEMSFIIHLFSFI